MELYVAAVGAIPSIEAWETDMRAVKLPYEYKKGEPKDLLRLGVGEMKLYKLFFPEDQLETVMKLVGVGTQESNIYDRHKIFKPIVKTLRKILGLEKAPLPKEVMMHMQPNQHTKAVRIIPIGTKKDLFNEEGIEQI